MVPLAVILGDIHFTVSTLELASSALRQAKEKAVELDVPLLLNGDTLDGKAIVRAEVVNRLIEIFTEDPIPRRVIINTGNHDLINNKSPESALNFLRPYAEVIQHPVYDRELESYIVPYMDDAEKLKEWLSATLYGCRLIMHTGLKTAYMGHYVADKTSLEKEEFDGHRVIASHYHRRQDIKCGETGLFSYIGSPYSVSFAEAGDPAKGFQVLYADGSLECVPTNLRKHLIFKRTTEEIKRMRRAGIRGALLGDMVDEPITNKDIIWLKITGIRSELAKIKKEELGIDLFGHSNFKLDLIALDEEPKEVKKEEKLTDFERLNKLIDETNENQEQKDYLKSLAVEVLE